MTLSLKGVTVLYPSLRVLSFRKQGGARLRMMGFGAHMVQLRRSWLTSCGPWRVVSVLLDYPSKANYFAITHNLQHPSCSSASRFLVTWLSFLSEITLSCLAPPDALSLTAFQGPALSLTSLRGVLSESSSSLQYCQSWWGLPIAE